jgi:hypothetical protein
MLDRATIDRLAESPEKNAPMLNVALAEEGTAKVLLALARCRAVGPDALEVIGARVLREGREVGRDAALEKQRDRRAPPEEPASEELDRLLIAHPRASSAVRDAVLGRHPKDPYFVLAAAGHAHATVTALEAAIDWPAASPLHDRLWVSLIDGGALPPLTLEEWADDERPLRREAAARHARSASLCARLARDPSRQVRRALASNRHAEVERRRLASEDPAVEVRLRAEGALSAHAELGADERLVETARFAAALRAMGTFGVLAPDVTRALSTDVLRVDAEGLRLAAQVLPKLDVLPLFEAVLSGGNSELRTALAAGLALRRPVRLGALPEEADEGELPTVAYEALKALSRASSDGLTGKARLAVWAAEGLGPCASLDPREVVGELGAGALGGERMVFARHKAARAALVRELAHAGRESAEVPAPLVELAWADGALSDEVVVELAARVARPRRRAEDLPEDELDLAPGCRSLSALERSVVAATARTNVSPRAALTVVALDSRRVRYVLAAMPSWKGRLSGGKLARVLRQNAGALSAAQAEGRARHAVVEGWTERRMSELELAIALAVGHLTATEIVRRIDIGRLTLDDGIGLPAGAEARAALEGAASIAPLLAWANRARAADPSALCAWLLLERFDRVRTPGLVASAVDALASSVGAVASSVCDALAELERREPGRLEAVAPQSPRGRATVASGIARAYRAVGGMRDERRDG